MENLVNDSSVDHRGQPPLRAATGAWKAAIFIILHELTERLTYFALSTSLVTYFTDVLHKDMKIAAKQSNYWTAVTTLLPLFAGFVADAYFGRFATVFVSTVFYLQGLLLLATSQLVHGLKPSHNLRLHEKLFFMGIYLVAIGTGGHKPALESFGADQFDDGHAPERVQKISFFNWWNCAVSSGVLVGTTAVVYVQEKDGRGDANVLVAVVMGVSFFIFLAGRRRYRYRVPEGSPLTPLLWVVVAAARKRHLELPADAGELYEVGLQGTNRLLCHTDRLRFLDKAAIVDHGSAGEGGHGAWWLATVTQVEETKLVLAMFPIWVATLPFGITAAQMNTLFIKQGSVMDRRLGPHFVLPAASIVTLVAVSMIVTVVLYDKVLEPYLRRVTGAERGISMLKRIGVGIAFSIVGMAVAAVVERRRLDRVAATTSVFWLLPQLIVMGVGDGFALVGLQEFFYEQVPDSMRSLGIGLYLSVTGASNLLSSLVIEAVSSRGGRQGWIGKDPNHSRLDLFYWLLAGIGAANLGFYVLVATRYTYKRIRAAT